jgi:hypothetical protein
LTLDGVAWVVCGIVLYLRGEARYFCAQQDARVAGQAIVRVKREGGGGQGELCGSGAHAAVKYGARVFWGEKKCKS